MEDASTQAQIADRQSKFQQARVLSRRSDYAFNYLKRIKQAGDEEDNSEAVRKATLLSNRQIMAFFNDKPDQSQEVAEQQKQESAINKAVAESRLSIIKQALLKKIIIEAQDKKEEEDAAAEEETPDQMSAQAQAKAAMRRGAIWIANSIASALDLSTAGVSLLINIVVYIFTFGWLNLEMIYGRHIAKGKSRFVPAISWAPIPMPIDPNALILQIFVIAADIIIGIAFFIMAAGGICVLHDFGKLVASPAGAGVILASGGEGMCLGGIMSMILNGF